MLTSLPCRPQVTLECLNLSPSGKLFKQDDKVAARVALVCKADSAELQQAVSDLLAEVQVRCESVWSCMWSCMWW